MLRMLNFLLIGLMLVGAGIVYDLKYEAERATSRVSKIQRKIERGLEDTPSANATEPAATEPKKDGG